MSFGDCPNLVEINVDKNNLFYSSINGVLFDKKQKMLLQYPSGKKGDYTIPDGVTIIDCFAFDHCSGLTSVSFPNSVSAINDFAFNYCTGLTSVVLPNALTKFNSNQFNQCTNIVSFTANPENPLFSSIDRVLFNKDHTNLIKFPNGKSGSYIIPNEVKSIEDGAFYNCDLLDSITIPESVAVINNLYCSNLMNIYVDDKNANYSSIDGVLTDKDRKTLLKFPGGRTGAYSIPDTIKVLPMWAFDNSKLSKITISKNITSLGEATFLNCYQLETVIIPDSVTNIHQRAFAGYDPNKLTLYVNPDSYALTYAQKFGIKYVIIDPRPADVPDTYWAVQFINIVMDRGLMSGSFDESGKCYFRPDDPTTRAEFAAVLFHYMELTPDGKAVFEDTNGHWAAPYIAKLADLGIMQGVSATEFAPDIPVTREQLATILCRALKPAAASSDFRYDDEAAISDWARDSVYAAHDAKWIRGYEAGVFKPEGTVIRAETAVIFARLLGVQEAF